MSPSSPNRAGISAPAVRVWLEAFAAHVRDRDVAAGRPLFAEDCRSFGTRGELLDGRDDLVARQWEPTWTTTQGFHFLEEGSRVEVAADGSMAVALVLWESEGVRADGTVFARRGRATIVLRPDPTDGRPVAVHSHFSLSPPPTLAPHACPRS